MINRADYTSNQKKAHDEAASPRQCKMSAVLFVLEEIWFPATLPGPPVLYRKTSNLCTKHA